MQEQRREFYRSVAGKCSKDTIATLESFKKKETEGEEYCYNGEYVPLGVWGQRGFDTDRIQRLTPESDKKEHNVLGVCYRVKILTTSNWRKREAEVTESMRASGSEKPSKVPKPTPGMGMLALEDGDPDGEPSGSDNESAESSSSTSSSSSSSDKKKKRHKSKKHSKKKDKKRKHKKDKKDKKDKKIKKENKEKKDARGNCCGCKCCASSRHCCLRVSYAFGGFSRELCIKVFPCCSAASAASFIASASAASAASYVSRFSVVLTACCV